MYLSFISAWFACLAIYSGSARQQLWRQQWPIIISYSIGLLLFIATTVLIANNFPLISAIIASLVLVFAFLPLITIVAAHNKRYFIWLSATIVSASLLFMLIGVA